MDLTLETKWSGGICSFVYKEHKRFVTTPDIPADALLWESIVDLYSHCIFSICHRREATALPFLAPVWNFLTFICPSPLAHSQTHQQSLCDNPRGGIVLLASSLGWEATPFGSNLMENPLLFPPRICSVQQVRLQAVRRRRPTVIAEWLCPDRPDLFEVGASWSAPGLLRHAGVSHRWRSPAAPRLILINGPFSAPEWAIIRG